ncbi:hypothetical protein IHE45_07G065600 [Dioscorea alata]|uniref:Uncharacterized protein n=1 Tax=Dioscorea alata TaxID=55571 RepID=A0ACB7VRJ1_DIOAL|nr:hypothetical protein IHE45_07G065600 [Dioscorea alata]
MKVYGIKLRLISLYKFFIIFYNYVIKQSILPSSSSLSLSRHPFLPPPISSITSPPPPRQPPTPPKKAPFKDRATARSTAGGATFARPFSVPPASSSSHANLRTNPTAKPSSGFSTKPNLHHRRHWLRHHPASSSPVRLVGWAPCPAVSIAEN